MNESEQNSVETTKTSSLNLDAHIKTAQRKGASLYVVGGGLTLFVLAVFFLWLFIVKGFVVIINPSEARPSALISLSKGLGYVSDNRFYVFGSRAQLMITAERFETTYLDINESTPSTLDVLLTPSPAVISADLSHLEGETSWYIDDKLVQVSKTFEYSIAPGTYQLNVDNPYYSDWTSVLNLERGETRQLELDLTRVEGQIVFNSVPSGASIFVDQRVVGQTPLTVPLAAGQYDIQLQLANYEALEDSIEILDDLTQPKRNYQLVPKKGQVEVNVSPTGGVLLLNGEATEPGLLSVSVSQKHQIRYSKEGFRPYQTSIDVDLQTKDVLNISLEKMIGEVNFTSNLPAQVYLDNKLIGLTPQIKALQSLPTKVEFKREGYRNVVKTFTPKDKASINVQAKILTEFEARRAEGRPLFVSTLGIEMQAFRPNAFTMGSPANEAGRSRNEHQVKVDFSRSIWVSRHEITQAQFAAFDNKIPKSNKPVTMVTWLQAAKYCNWLSENEGLPAFYRIKNNQLLGFNQDSKGYRLPTEAEWEWLARKANRATATKYVWGNSDRLKNKIANFSDKSAKGNQFVLDKFDDGFADIAPVGSFKADRAGLFDLAGNVQEWVNDFYTNTSPNTVDVQVDYLGPLRGQQHVVKGASFNTGKFKDLRAAKRTIGEGAKNDLGFRIARYH
jgi:formylglycine-generating enzyme required for sulfatase activity